MSDRARFLRSALSDSADTAVADVPLRLRTDPSALSVWLRLLECHNLILGQLRKEAAKDGTSLARFDLLANLMRRDGMTLSELSRRMLVTAGNVTGIVARSERDGLVRRTVDPLDRRLARVHLTKRGRKLIDGMTKKHARDVGALFSRVAEDDRAVLGRVLGELRDHLRNEARS